MNHEEKIAKQQEILKKYHDSATLNLTAGIRILRYFKNSEADLLEEQLLQLQTYFTKMPKSGKEFKQMTEQLEGLSYYLVHLYNNEFLKNNYDVDDTYAEEINHNDVKYRGKLAKSLEAKQKKAPGFDGQGGRSAH